MHSMCPARGPMAVPASALKSALTKLVFTTAGLLLTHGPLAPLGITPSTEVVKALAEATLALVLFSGASRVGLGHLRTDLGLRLRLLGLVSVLVSFTPVRGRSWANAGCLSVKVRYARGRW